MENESLVLDLLEWIGPRARPHGDVMEAWRTSCPRLAIWEVALEAGLVEVRDRAVSVTAAGFEFLRSRRVSRSPVLEDNRVAERGLEFAAQEAR